MPISARVIARSKAPCGKIVTTWESIYPRMIHDEILTHGMVARNSASSRAIPTEKLIRRVIDDPWVPSYIGTNQKGMQAGQELPEIARRHAVNNWLMLRDRAVETAEELMRLGTHKQVVNRILQPWMWITVIMSMTEDENFFGLRDHEMAEPHFQELARAMRASRDATKPRELQAGEWHLPLWGPENGGQVDDEEALQDLIVHIGDRNPMGHGDADPNVLRAKIAVGRCARVSYLTHDGRRDLKDDIALFERLATGRPMHASPLEHVCKALDWPDWFKEDRPELVALGVNRLQTKLIEERDKREKNTLGPTGWEADGWAVLGELRSGRFLGFQQFRKMFLDENIGGRVP